MDDSILVVDDERDFLESVRRGLITSGFRNVRIEEDPRRAIDFFEKGEEFDAILIDINMTPINGVEVLRTVKRLSPGTECVMVSALDEARLAVSCIKKGAYDYLVKPVSKEDLVSTVGRALEHRRLIRIMEIGKGWDLPRIDNQAAFAGIATQSPNMLRVLREAELQEAELHAASDIPILVTGETGTGKELIARAIHAASPRSAGPFTAVNMESLNPTLFESQFFGFTKGAFTGADTDHTGYLEAADRGTLFLDEIGYMPIEMQGKLLRVLQEGEYYKIGTTVPKKVNVRFIAATNADLQRQMAKGLFRKDMFYRLRGGWLHLPPLRERRDDIPLLLKRFTVEFRGERGVGYEEEVMALLKAHDFPGNVRELKSVFQAALNLASRKPLATRHLPEEIRRLKAVAVAAAGNAPKVERIAPLDKMEKEHILKAYDACGRVKARTAQVLGIGLNTLRRKLESYGIE
jgi:DNA-binding NtrC family response regulator